MFVAPVSGYDSLYGCTLGHQSVVGRCWNRHFFVSSIFTSEVSGGLVDDLQ